jgi:hypothetical protein
MYHRKESSVMKQKYPREDRVFTAEDFENVPSCEPLERNRCGSPRPVEVEELDQFAMQGWNIMIQSS